MATVLIADDQLALRVLMSATLRAAKHDVIEASDGDEAWACLCRERPPLAILDIQMPGKTGLELLQAIRNEPRLARTKVILVSGKAQQSDVETGLVHGADEYLVKPFSPAKLAQLADEMLRAETAPES